MYVFKKSLSSLYNKKQINNVVRKYKTEVINVYETCGTFVLWSEPNSEKVAC